MAKRKVFPTKKPYPTFPLTPRPDGRFVKKIRGQQHVFGSGGDAQAALTEYTQKAEALHAGRPAPANVSDVVTISQCANRYLDARKRDVDSGQLKLGSWDNYRTTLKRFVKLIGPSTVASSLRPPDFERFAVHQKKTLGSRSYNKSRSLIKAWIKYAVASEWMQSVNFGVAFQKIPAGKIRGERKLKLFTPDQVRVLLQIAAPQLKAMILLGVNGGFGNSDCSELLKANVDLEAGVIRYPRVKTNIARTVTLWPETVEALTPLMKLRPDDAHVFRTKHGKLWVRTEMVGKRVITKDSVAMNFAKLLKEVCMTDAKAGTIKDQLPGIGFYALRHTFATYANEVRDNDARLHIMGRQLTGIDGEVYVEKIFLERLRVVTDRVREKVLG